MKNLIDIVVIAIIPVAIAWISLKALFSFFELCFYLKELYCYQLVFKDYEAELELIRQERDNLQKTDDFYLKLSQDIARYHQLTGSHHIIYKLWRVFARESRLVSTAHNFKINNN